MYVNILGARLCCAVGGWEVNGLTCHGNEGQTVTRCSWRPHHWPWAPPRAGGGEEADHEGLAPSLVHYLLSRKLAPRLRNSGATTFLFVTLGIESGLISAAARWRRRRRRGGARQAATQTSTGLCYGCPWLAGQGASLRITKKSKSKHGNSRGNVAKAHKHWRCLPEIGLYVSCTFAIC